LKKRNGILVAIALVLSFIVGILFNTLFPTLNPLNRGGLTSKQINLLNEAEKIINDTAINGSDSDHTVDYALKGMAASLDDDYAYYYTAEEMAQYENSTNGIVEGGIGITVYNDNGAATVTEVYKGLSADEAGLKKGDIITEVDDILMDESTYSDISSLIKGEVGTQVMLTVLRNGQTLKFNVMRTSGQRQMTEYRMLENGILYIRILSFHGNAVDYFKKAIECGESNNYKSLIIDLRDNLGGDLTIFSEIADILLPEGETFYALDKNSEKMNVCTSDEDCIDKPICVLQNGNTASASEALSGAIKCMGDATVIGTVSYGKGIMQTAYTLSNGGCFKLTVARYYLPSGECIHKKGITPDIEVDLSDELKQKAWLLTDENDLQLKKAIEVLTN